MAEFSANIVGPIEAPDSIPNENAPDMFGGVGYEEARSFYR
jgi:hypothetical protein